MRSILIAGLVVCGCYSPDLRDCTVTCSAGDECGDGQICAGGLCRAETATCEGPGPGPAPKVQLRVEVEGEGMVLVDGLGACEHDGGGSHMCDWMIAPGTQLVLEAMVIDDKPFERWTTANCGGQDASCSFTATAAASVGAKFK